MKKILIGILAFIGAIAILIGGWIGAGWAASKKLGAGDGAEGSTDKED